MKGYKMWFQPYEHREAYVQSRSRKAPHGSAGEQYAGLVRVAQSVQRDGVVVVTSGDFDYREIVLNWAAHNAKLGCACRSCPPRSRPIPALHAPSPDRPTPTPVASLPHAERVAAARARHELARGLDGR